jgi:hypothetical protein
MSFYVAGSTVADVRREIDAWEETHGPVLFDVEVTPFLPGEPVAVDVSAATEAEARATVASLIAHFGPDRAREFADAWRSGAA